MSLCDAVDAVDDLGFGISPEAVISESEADLLRNGFSDASLFRKVIDLERYRFGAGRYCYYRYPLPDVVERLRTECYSAFVALANEWRQRLGEPVLPGEFAS